MITLARILNNTNNWEKPSGTQHTAGFTEQHRFGYEEWLNSSYLNTGNKRYGFIQAFHDRVPSGDYSKVFLYTYYKRNYKIVGVVSNLEYLPFQDRGVIEKELIIGNQEAFQNDIMSVTSSIPLNHEDARFKVNFRVNKQSDLILNAGKAVQITLTDYPEIYAYLRRGKFHRLSVLYKLDESLYEEMAKIEQQLMGIASE